MLLFTDFKKAFDTLERKFSEKTPRFYNFGDSLITWIKLLYTDIIQTLAAAYKIMGGPQISSSYKSSHFVKPIGWSMAAMLRDSVAAAAVVRAHEQHR